MMVRLTAREAITWYLEARRVVVTSDQIARATNLSLSLVRKTLCSMRSDRIVDRWVVGNSKGGVRDLNSARLVTDRSDPLSKRKVYYQLRSDKL